MNHIYNSESQGNYSFKLCDAPSEPSPVYKPVHSVYALICFIFGYLFIRWLGMSSLGFSAFLFVGGFSIFSLVVMLVEYIPKKRKASLFSVLLLAINSLLSVVFLIAPGETITFFTLLFEVLSYLIWYYITFCENAGILNDTFFYDVIKAVFVMPFGSFINIFPALIAPLKKGKAGKHIAYIFLGIAIAVIPGIIVIALLSSADPAFGKLVKSISDSVFGSSISEIILNFYIIVFSVPVAMYIFGMIYSNTEKRYSHILNEASKRNHAESMSRLPVLMVCSALIPLCLIYILFFISQIGYYIDAFQKIIPSGYTAAEYARSGFFQLCAVASINLFVILFASVFSKKNSSKQSAAIRILNVILSAFTLILIATAVRKMILYIELYGFTRLRVLTSWFMLLLSVIFLFIIIRQFKASFNAVLSSSIAFIIMFTVLCLVNVDARIAELNVSMYRNGTLTTCDIDSFYELSYSAAEYVIPLLSDENTEMASSARSYLEYQADCIEKGYYTSNGWKDYTVSLLRISELLSEALDREIIIGRKA